MADRLKEHIGKIAFSPLSGKIYFVDKKIQKHDVTNSFYNCVLLWALDGRERLDEATRVLNVHADEFWEITVKRIK